MKNNIISGCLLSNENIYTKGILKNDLYKCEHEKNNLLMRYAISKIYLAAYSLLHLHLHLVI